MFVLLNFTQQFVSVDYFYVKKSKEIILKGYSVHTVLAPSLNVVLQRNLFDCEEMEVLKMEGWGGGVSGQFSLQMQLSKTGEYDIEPKTKKTKALKFVLYIRI